MIKGFPSLPGMERERTLQVEIPFVNVHFSCKRVTSLFSELLLCLVSQMNPMPKRYFQGRIFFCCPSPIKVSCISEHRGRLLSCFLSPGGTSRVSGRLPPAHLLKPFLPLMPYSTATMMGQARQELLLQGSKQEMGCQSVLSCRTPNLRGCIARLLL